MTLAADGSLSAVATGSVTVAGALVAGSITYSDADNWTLTAKTSGADSWVKDTAGTITYQGSFSASFVIGGATFVGSGTASTGVSGSTVYSAMTGSVSFSQGGQT